MSVNALDEQSKIGILLVHFGLPAKSTEKEIRKYVRSILLDKRMFRSFRPIWFIRVNLFLTARMSKMIRNEITAIWKKGFRYAKQCNRQRAAISDNLQSLGIENIVTASVFRYGSPSIRDGLKHLMNSSCEKILVVPMSPQSSYSFTASVYDVWKKEKRRHAGSIEYRFIDNFYNDPGYLDCLSNSILDTLDELAEQKSAWRSNNSDNLDNSDEAASPLTFDNSDETDPQKPVVSLDSPREAVSQAVSQKSVTNLDNPLDILASKRKLVFVFRTCSLRDIVKGDKYELQTSATSLGVAKRLGLKRKDWTIAYLPSIISKDKQTFTLTPTLDEALSRFKIGKVKDVVIVTPGNIIGSIDTAYMIDHEAREKFVTLFDDDSSGEDINFTLVPPLSTREDFTRSMAELIFDNLYNWK